MGNNFDQPHTSEDALPPHPLEQKFRDDLERLNSVSLSGDLIADVQEYCRAVGTTLPRLAEALQQGDREFIKKFVKESIEAMHTFLGQAAMRDSSLDGIPAAQEVVRKKNEILTRILELSNLN